MAKFVYERCPGINDFNIFLKEMELRVLKQSLKSQMDLFGLVFQSNSHTYSCTP